MREDETVFCSKCNLAWPRSALEPDFGHSCDPEENVFSPCCGALCEDDEGNPVETGGLAWLHGDEDDSS